MKLTTKGRYGLMAIEVLKENYGKGPISIKAIAEEKNISEAYLEQLFSLMKKEGIVKSIRGSKGGYQLAKEPSEITIGAVLRSLEGDTQLACCDGDDYICEDVETCGMKNVLHRIESEFTKITNSIKVSEL